MFESSLVKLNLVPLRVSWNSDPGSRGEVVIVVGMLNGNTQSRNRDRSTTYLCVGLKLPPGWQLV